ncbi:FAD-dependent oxidoreductase domain-containing protein 2-like [Ptychodera flava]|uniref:FAD-dependent oxidoreductase domain-containing protein 2-like n=1 Tax=Ptychodera flava TaxID=63121 RepID=UPI00396A55E1
MPTKTRYHETIIIGAGPAGLQMAYFMKKAKRDYVILEAATRPGHFFTHEPRHRLLISINKRFNPFPDFEYNMRHDWNSLLSDDRSLLFPKYSEDLYPKADDLLRYLDDFARKTEVSAVYNTRVINISKQNRPGAADGLFYLKTNDGREYSCKVLLMATGAVSERLADIPGIEHATPYSEHDLDTKKYEGKLVAIIGRGNSAFEVADYLAPYAAYIHIFGARALKHAWNTHFVGDLRAINNNVLDMYQLKSLHSYFGIECVKLSKKPGDEQVTLHFRDIVLHWNTPGYFFDTKPYDYVISCAGWNYIDSTIFADDIKPETKKKGKYPLLKKNWESVNIENLFFIGTSMQSNDRKAASGFIHGFRYNIRTLHHMLEEKYQNVPYPVKLFPRDVSPIADYIIERASVDAAIYQLNTFMGDVIIVPDDPKEKVRYYIDMPMDYVKEQDWFKNAKHAFTTYLKYNFDRFEEYSKDTLTFTHWPQSYDQHCQAFLRPLVNYYRKGELVDEIGAVESLVLRFDTKEFKTDNPDKNRNLFKNFLNKYLNFNPGVNYYDYFLTYKEAWNKHVVPLTEEERSRVPPEFFQMEGVKCRPTTMDLKPKM